MLLIQPTIPNMASKNLTRTDLSIKAHERAAALIDTPAAIVPANPDDTAITPAAPPSAVQMQIKALITEQTQSPEAISEETDQT